MKKSYRVKRTIDFSAIFKEGTSVANRQFVIYQLSQSKDHFRVGLSISKKLGNAVTRNRIKRRLRHIVLDFSPYLVPADFVIIARKGVETLTYQEMTKNLCHVLRLANIYQEGDAHAPDL